ncbi:molecular chaperone [Pectobacterium cacticida]|uniref:molecular chaperone n=1 Tax=Pectobacterium cacticida TaxID=69221 RepID=UPI002FF19AFA
MTPDALLPRILGALFYYSPERPEVKALLDCLKILPELYPWRDPARIAPLCEDCPMPDHDALLWQFSVLFEGQGEMPIPPWGSVWLERDNLLMGNTTAEYRAFLQSQNMIFDSRQNEPEDQFGLMLLACSALFEAGKEAAVNQLLEIYLLPWGYRYLERLRDNVISPFYARLAAITMLYLQDIERQRGLQPVEKRLFFG